MCWLRGSTTRPHIHPRIPAELLWRWSRIDPRDTETARLERRNTPARTEAGKREETQYVAARWGGGKEEGGGGSEHSAETFLLTRYSGGAIVVRQVSRTYDGPKKACTRTPPVRLHTRLGSDYYY